FDGFWADCAVHWRETRLHPADGSAETGAERVAVLVEEAAEPSGLLLSLGQHQYRRAAVGFGSIVDRYGDPDVRRDDLPGLLRSHGSERPGAGDFQPDRLDVAFGRYANSAARLDAGDWIPAVSLGQLQRNDDDVPDGAGVVDASIADRSLE